MDPKRLAYTHDQRGRWVNSIMRYPISSAVYGGVKGYGSAGRYGYSACRGVSVRRSTCARSAADNSLSVFQVRSEASFSPVPHTGETPKVEDNKHSKS